MTPIDKSTEGEKVARIEYVLCSPMECVPNTLLARVSTNLGSLEVAIKQLQPEDSPVLYAKRAPDASRVDLAVVVEYERRPPFIIGVYVKAKREIEAGNQRELFIDLLGEPFTLETLASSMTKRQALTGRLEVIGNQANLVDLFDNKVNKCDLKLTGSVLELLPQLIQQGKKRGLLDAQFNLTYNKIPGKKNPHKMVQIVLLPPEWLQLVIDITAQLMKIYNKAKGYPPSAQSLLPVLQDAGQSAEMVPDLRNPTGHYTGPLILYDFDPKKFDNFKEAERQNSLDQLLFLDQHMDGPNGNAVFTLTFQTPTKTADGEPSKATPTVVGSRLRGGGSLDPNNGSPREP